MRIIDLPCNPQTAKPEYVSKKGTSPFTQQRVYAVICSFGIVDLHHWSLFQQKSSETQQKIYVASILKLVSVRHDLFIYVHGSLQLGFLSHG